MKTFKAGLLAGAVLGSITAATVFAQFGTPSNTPIRPAEAMASRAGDGRTGAPGIGTGPGSVNGVAIGDAGHGAGANRPWADRP